MTVDAVIENWRLLAAIGAALVLIIALVVMNERVTRQTRRIEKLECVEEYRRQKRRIRP